MNNHHQTKAFKRYTVTSALPYANGPIHIGHLAGVYVPSDIYVRYLRMKKEDVVFICGSDEHGVPITIKARQENITPQQVVDKYHQINGDAFNKLGISFDIYHRTTAPLHHETASQIFKTIYDKGIFEENDSEQYFDEKENQFLADRYITGTCPHCSYEKAYGDQCENCGTSLNPQDLIEPKSVLSGNKPVLKKTKHWYLPLNKYEDVLSKWILDGHKSDWKTNVYGQCKSWLDHGLQPRAVTRDLEWGVKVPVEDSEGKVLYVWFDAPIGYISATREWAKENGKDWEPYWKSDDTKLVHFIGKDNIVFHCIIFPVILMAEGSYILPENVPANEFLNLEGDKISTSRNWAVWLHEYLEEFPGKQDVLRYALCATAPETKDNDFTWKDFQSRNNSELLAIFGNFVNRTLVLTHKYYEGKVPSLGEITEQDKAVIEQIKAFPGIIANSLDKYRFREAVGEMMNLARLGNKYLTDEEPWKVIKTNPERVKTVLNISLQICANLSLVCAPFIPFTAEKMSKMLNIKELLWDDAGRLDLLKENDLINQPELLFEKIEDETIQKQIDKLQNTKQQNIINAKADPLKPEISFDDFQKMDIRTAIVLKAEKVAKTKKLLKLEVDTGVDIRTVVSGIAEYFNPEDVIGKKVLILANLQPRLIKDIESHGMILMAERRDGSLYFVSAGDDVEKGCKIS
ncbi:MAG: methionine--tRNA ligase [Bacteroidetes bacterium]|nr:methionine--tRNA ligase [Bacteroidota bacterium]